MSALPDQPVQANGRWGDLRKRSLSAALLAPLAILCIWLGAAGWTALVAIAAIGLGLEWSALCGYKPLEWPGHTVALQITTAGILTILGLHWAAILLLLIGAITVWRVSDRRALAAGVLYVGIPLVALAWLRGNSPVGRDDVLFLVIVVWAADIGAYAIGRALGGPKLAPAISPGKTWSGAIGGLLIAMAAGEAASQLLDPAPPGRAAAVACILAVASIAGDLLESWIKRRFGVKDSGRLIPGHGGLLDRLDGLLAAAPAAAMLAIILGREGVLWK